MLINCGTDIIPKPRKFPYLIGLSDYHSIRKIETQGFIPKMILSEAILSPVESFYSVPVIFKVETLSDACLLFILVLIEATGSNEPKEKGFPHGKYLPSKLIPSISFLNEILHCGCCVLNFIFIEGS